MKMNRNTSMHIHTIFNGMHCFIVMKHRSEMELCKEYEESVVRNIQK